MGPRFSSFLSQYKRQRNNGAPSPAGTDLVNSLAAQAIGLSQDCIEESPVTLHWDRLDGDGGGDTLLLVIGLIEGIREGTPAIRATRLYETAPDLFDATPPENALIRLQLPAIVRQLANLLPEAPEPPEIADPSFETPFWRQAAEEQARRAQRKTLAPPPPPSPETTSEESASQAPEYEPTDRPNTPLELLRQLDSRNPSTEERPQEPPEPPPAVADNDNIQKHQAVLKEAPPPPAQPDLTLAENKAPTPQTKQTLTKPLPSAQQARRAAIERLQEIFLLEEDLDAELVAQEIVKLPRIVGVVLLRGNAFLASVLPATYDLNAALTAPAVIARLAAFTRELGEEAFSSVTISATRQITLIWEGTLLLLVIHQERFVPGVRQKLVETARALDALYRALES